MVSVRRVHGPGPSNEMIITLESGASCGSGRFANVYRATLTSPIVQAVAIKNVWEEKNSPPPPSVEPAEISILSQLDHPNVVRLLYHYSRQIEGERMHCLVLNYMPEDMDKLRKRGVFLDLLDACLYGYQLFAACAYLATKNVLHLDIKPANLLVDHPKGLLQLGDFGNAQEIEGKEFEHAQNYQVTRYYRAPEIVFGSKYFSTAIDTWAAACCMVEFMTGRVLFKGKSATEQMKLLIEVFGYPTDEDVKVMRISRPRTSRPTPRGLDKYTGGELPSDLMDLLRLVFVFNPTRRTTAAACLDMKFFYRLKGKLAPKRVNGSVIPCLFGVKQTKSDEGDTDSEKNN